MTELTIALYSVLDPFRDKVIWDVGHQSYVHKILTGRNAEFDTLRELDGISGFPKREESEADCFDTGHSSTSVSAAVGMARARDIKGEQYRVAAVIGDGAFTNGMVYEALNDAGRMFSSVVFILNDNGMSISRNVGGISKYLGKIRTGKSYIRIKKNVKRIIGKIPLIGNFLVRKIQLLKAAFRLLAIPGEWFEALGVKYIGPVDGHNIPEIEKALNKAFYMNWPRAAARDYEKRTWLCKRRSKPKLLPRCVCAFGSGGKGTKLLRSDGGGAEPIGRTGSRHCSRHGGDAFRDGPGIIRKTLSGTLF